MNKKNKVTKGKNIISDSSVNVEGNFHIGDIVNIEETTRKNSAQHQVAKINIDKARKLIGQNQIRQVLEFLLLQTPKIDLDLHHQLIHQSQRWNQLLKDQHHGTIGQDEINIIHNRIVAALLAIINGLDELIKES